MRPVVITQSGAGQTATVPLDRNIANFNVSVYAKVTGTVAYAIQYTYDDPFATASGSINWIDSEQAPTGTTTSKEQVFQTPVAAVRINQASGAGSVQATIVQSGIV